jgi:hypothetical protein
MHAVFIDVSVKGTDDEALAQLRSDVVPRVKEAPGFVAGYWTRTDTSGRACVIFDSDSTAQGAAEMIKSNPPSEVTLQNIEVREVVASA